MTSSGVWGALFEREAQQPNLEIFRIVFGFVCAAYFLKRLSSARLTLGPGGLADNLWRVEDSRWRLSPFVLLPRSNLLVFGLPALGAMAAVSLCIGFHTQFSAGLLFAVQLMLVSELPKFSSGVDFVTVMMSLLLALSAAGAGWGVDAGWQAPATTPVWATSLMQLQVSILYLSAGLLKLSEKQWRSGWAIYYSVCSIGNARQFSPVLTKWPWLTRVMTWQALVLEVCGPALLWWPDGRRYAWIAFVGLHVGIDVLFSLWPFSWIMLAVLCLFFYPVDWAFLLA